MQDIAKALEGIFQYPRRGRELGYKLIESSVASEGGDGTNIRVQDYALGISGVIPMVGDIWNKQVLAVYTAEPDLPVAGPKLPGTLGAYNDCAKVHMGVLANCLKRLYPGRVHELRCVINETNEMVGLNVRDDIAQLFFDYIIAQRAPAPAEKLKKGEVPKNQTAIF